MTNWVETLRSVGLPDDVVRGEILGVLMLEAELDGATDNRVALESKGRLDEADRAEERLARLLAAYAQEVQRVLDRFRSACRQKREDLTTELFDG